MAAAFGPEPHGLTSTLLTDQGAQPGLHRHRAGPADHRAAADWEPVATGEVNDVVDVHRNPGRAAEAVLTAGAASPAGTAKAGPDNPGSGAAAPDSTGTAGADTGSAPAVAAVAALAVMADAATTRSATDGAEPAAVPPDVRILCEIRWPQFPGDVAPLLAGFTVSSFNPLVAEAAARCLAARPPEPPAGRTALLLASHSGDRDTARAISAAVAAGRQVPPLLFFQSNPNAVLGHVAARWNLTGPVVAISRPGRLPGLTHEVLAEAALLLQDGDADEVLVVVAEQARTAEETDEAVAALVARRG